MPILIALCWCGTHPPAALAQTNIALGKPTFESDSTSDPGAFLRPSSKAVDGNTDGNYADGSVTHNGTANPVAYWYVDLQGSYSISSINIWGRTDCCQDRLNGATVSVFAAGQNPNTSTTPVWSGQIGAVPTPTANSQLAGSFTPGAIGQYVRVQLNPNSAGYLSLAEVQVYGTAATSGGSQPAIASVVTTSSQAAQIAQNTWVEVHGANLSQTTTDWSKSNFSNGLPTTLANVSATVDGKPAAIYYVSPTQVNLLTPLDNATGSVSVQLNTPNGQTPVKTVTELQTSPAFLVIDATGHVAARHADTSLLGPPSLSAPGYTFTAGKPGETVLFYATGFGQTSPAISNQLSGLGPLPTLPNVTIGGAHATVSYAGLSGPGLYQFNVTIPTSAANGDLPLTATYNGSSTQNGVVVTVAAPSGPTGPNGQNVTLSVTNKLIYPVDVTVNGNVVTRVAASSSGNVTVAGTYGMQVGYNLVRPTTTSGTAVGEPMSGTFAAVANPSGTLSYVVNNVLSGQAYFAPSINNTSGAGALMGVNMGLSDQNECNCIIAASGTSTIGYYKLFTNSNVRAYPASSNYSASSGYEFWGQDPGNAPNATFPAVAVDTGTVGLNLNTAPGGGGSGGGGSGGGGTGGGGTAGNTCAVSIPYNGYGQNWVCILLTNAKAAGYWNGSLSSAPQLPTLTSAAAQRDEDVEAAVIDAFLAATSTSNPATASMYAHNMIQSLQDAYSLCSNAPGLGGTLVTLNLFGCSVAPNPVPAQ